MSIEFYFDPSCPWCWVTSRWLTIVEAERDLDITWLPFSLAMKNGELGNDPYAKSHLASQRVHRIIEKIAQDNQATRGDLYTAFGKAHFVDEASYDDTLIKSVLAELNISADRYLPSADDTSLDAALQTHLDNAIDIVGDDVGVPLIIFVHDDGSKVGYFGPVITELPDKQEALDLWDGLEKLASNKSFFELKRSRTSGANTASTRDLFS